MFNVSGSRRSRGSRQNKLPKVANFFYSFIKPDFSQPISGPRIQSNLSHCADCKAVACSMTVHKAQPNQTNRKHSPPSLLNLYIHKIKINTNININISNRPTSNKQYQSFAAPQLHSQSSKWPPHPPAAARAPKPASGMDSIHTFLRDNSLHNTVPNKPSVHAARGLLFSAHVERQRPRMQ
jgi:hypothetical protein